MGDQGCQLRLQVKRVLGKTGSEKTLVPQEGQGLTFYVKSTIPSGKAFHFLAMSSVAPSLMSLGGVTASSRVGGRSNEIEEVQKLVLHVFDFELGRKDADDGKLTHEQRGEALF